MVCNLQNALHVACFIFTVNCVIGYIPFQFCDKVALGFKKL